MIQLAESHHPPEAGDGLWLAAQPPPSISFFVRVFLKGYRRQFLPIYARALVFTLLFGVIESIRAARPVRVIGKSPDIAMLTVSGKLGTDKSHGAGSIVPSPPGFGRRRSSPKYL